MGKFSKFGESYWLEQKRYLELIDRNPLLPPAMPPGKCLYSLNIEETNPVLPQNLRLDFNRLVKAPFLYESLNDQEKKWYFYWRRQYENGNPIKTNLEDCLILIYEWFSSSNLMPEEVLGKIDKIMAEYPLFTQAMKPKLYFWKTQFALEHGLPFPSLEGLNEEDLQYPEIAFLADWKLTQLRSDEILSMPSGLIRMFCKTDYLADDGFLGQYCNLNMVKQRITNLFLWLDLNYKEKYGKSLLQYFGPNHLSEHSYFIPVNPVTREDRFSVHLYHFSGSQRFLSLMTLVTEEFGSYLDKRVPRGRKGFLKQTEHTELILLIKAYLLEALRKPDGNFLRYSTRSSINMHSVYYKHLEQVQLLSIDRMLQAIEKIDKQKQSAASKKPKPSSTALSRNKQKKKEDSFEDKLDYSRIEQLREESDEVREALRVDEEEQDLKEDGTLQEDQQLFRYHEQLHKFAAALHNPEKKFLQKLAEKNGALPSSPKRLQVMETINELSDIYLHRGVLGLKGKKIYITFSSMTELQVVLGSVLQDNGAARKSAAVDESAISAEADSDQNVKSKGTGAVETKSSLEKPVNSGKEKDQKNRRPEDQTGSHQKEVQAGNRLKPYNWYQDPNVPESMQASLKQWEDFIESLTDTDWKVLEILLADMDEDKKRSDLEQLAELSFMMSDLLVDELNIRFESCFMDILVDGEALTVDEAYLEPLRYLFKWQKMD